MYRSRHRLYMPETSSARVLFAVDSTSSLAPGALSILIILMILLIISTYVIMYYVERVSFNIPN